MPEVVTDEVPDEPLGSHVLELEVADVLAETDEARSLVFRVPEGAGDPAIPADRLRYAPGQFLTLRRWLRAKGRDADLQNRLVQQQHAQPSE